MKRTLITVAFASAAMLTAAQAQTIGTATTDLNIRSGPDPQFPVIGMLRNNQRATVIGCIEGSRWCQIDLRGRTGWAYSQYMLMSGDIAAVLPVPELEVDVATRPVIAAPPAVAYRAPVPVATYQPPVATYQAPVATYQPAYPPVTYQPVATYQPAYPSVTYQSPAPVVAYDTAPAVTYQAPPVVAYQTAPAVTYQTAPTVAYRAPATTVVETTAAAPRDFAGRLIPPRETIYAATNAPRAYVPPRAVRTYLTANPIDTVWLEGSLVTGASLPEEVDLMPVPGSRYQYAYVNDYAVLVEPGSRRIVYVSR
ncbi:DUF1236 domain-containing protein [Pseudorhodoplanes sp.]|uniref:DUF1236 domain-containing protein n=1 Tax=Pseudorhodoplanes sp. TaxID=1934341 RepID=UPI002CF7DAB6|nr:DUF1236 domain-containing protein [Pseudorhodoplanes sp.]HWV52658.1 DUF1236 domain-containing protein [Pseudorhodoplanes sp.]